MRAELDKDGRLLAPKSRERGVERVKQLRHECAKIEGQLADPRRVPKSRDRQNARLDALAWAERARLALEKFRSEERQLAAWLQGWLAAEHRDEALLEEAYELLADLEKLEAGDALRKTVDKLEARLYAERATPAEKAS